MLERGREGAEEQWGGCVREVERGRDARERGGGGFMCLFRGMAPDFELQRQQSAGLGVVI
jgi:hypothetical protein